MYLLIHWKQASLSALMSVVIVEQGEVVAESALKVGCPTACSFWSGLVSDCQKG
jgi:hypothetical protein